MGCEKTLSEAYRIAKQNRGDPGIDNQMFKDIESSGRRKFLLEIQEELISGKYKPMLNRQVEIPKDNSKTRALQIPCIRDRVTHGELKLLLETIFEADFCSNSYGFRPKRSQHRALAEVRRRILRRMTTVIDVDLSQYFDTIRHSVLLNKIAKRVEDPEVMRRKTSVGWRRWCNEYLYDVLGLYLDWKIHPLPGLGKGS